MRSKPDLPRPGDAGYVNTLRLYQEAGTVTRGRFLELLTFHGEQLRNGGPSMEDALPQLLADGTLEPYRSNPRVCDVCARTFYRVKLGEGRTGSYCSAKCWQASL